MTQKVPFTKDITFKTKIGEITSISLENDLALKGEDLISGNFYLSGTYKMLETSTNAEEYSYKIPCDIAISTEYDTFDSTVDIEDFYYEIIDDEVLRINIVVAISGLEKKEEEIKEEITIEKEPEKEELLFDEEDRNESVSFMEVKEKVINQKDSYLTYKVYIMKDTDTIDTVLEKYSLTKDELEDYNDLENLTGCSKLVIPSLKDAEV